MRLPVIDEAVSNQVVDSMLTRPTHLSLHFVLKIMELFPLQGIRSSATTKTYSSFFDVKDTTRSKARTPDSTADNHG